MLARLASSAALAPRAATLAVLATWAPAQVDFASSIDAMGDLMRLAQPPRPAYVMRQFASQDRRSVGPEQPGWFSNSDGFGGEPEPGFAAVLKAPDASGNGAFLLADVAGPGVLVRSWSAGMAGTLRVWLDDAETPLFEGSGYDFLARRSARWLADPAVGIDAGDTFVQQDADYLPIPFARRLRITWDGSLRELHFYHLQVKSYPAGTAVTTFTLADLLRERARIRWLVDLLRDPDATWRDLDGARTEQVEGDVAPGKPLALEVAQSGGGVVRALVVRVDGQPTPAALRGVLLRVACDGAQRPQVEAPLGDFFGTGPGLNPFRSLPMTVSEDGVLTCRLPMPFRGRLRLELRNLGAARFTCRLAATVAPFPEAASAYLFRAKWRVDHELDPAGSKEPIDLPYVMLRGEGRLVGAACMLMNPARIPTPGGNWWGEGDEKIVVDEDGRPALFGTGSEDFFDYAWSRPDLFAHPYCGQPLDTGPGNAGYVSNHRFLVADDVPFARSLWFAMELWTHRPLRQLSYARIAYCYAARDCLDDHRALQAGELIVPPLPRFEPLADGGAAGATFHYAEDLLGDDHPGTRTVAADWLSRGRYLDWRAAAGDRLAMRIPVPNQGEHALHVVFVHAPDGGAVRAHLDGQRVGDVVAVRSQHLTYARSAALGTARLAAGEHELVLTCETAGSIGIEYLWVRRERD